MDIKREYLASFESEDTYEYNLWLEYYYLTEAMDRSLPNVPRRDGAMVIPPYTSISSRYAYQLKNILYKRFGVSSKKYWNSLARFSFEELRIRYMSLDEHPLTEESNNI